MLSKRASFDKETFKKNIKFISLAIPILFALVTIQSTFNMYMNAKEFTTLPKNIREEHITSLFFRADVWNFPLSIINSFESRIPLSLTDNIPFMAMLYKVFNIQTDQYFGLWILISFFLYTFFAYRICKNIFVENFIIRCFGTLLFLMLPFTWYHSIYIPWFAGQWLVLWAYSIYFKEKPCISNEWFGLLIFSSFVHPFFAFTTFLIMISDMIHLYIYNYSISSYKVASSFSYMFTAMFITMSILGIFYLPILQNDAIVIPPLSFFNNTHNNDIYNISYFQLGKGVFIGFILSLILAFYHAKKLKKYFYYYRALLSTVLILLFCASLGGIQITKSLFVNIPLNSWGKEYLYPFFTSGPKFFIPILYLLPIFILAIVYRIEKRKKYAGSFFLTMICIIQIMDNSYFTSLKYKNFEPLDSTTTQFIENTTVFEWVFLTEIPFRPDLYEQLAYYAFNNNISINAFPLIRFPTKYQENLIKTKQHFLIKDFHKNTIYIIKETEFPKEYLTLGKTIQIENNILFKPY